MPIPKPLFTSSELIQAIHLLVEHINSGDSINLAKKKVCGGSQNKFAKQIAAHPLYLHILNDYMISRKYNRSFYWDLTGMKQGPLRVPELLKEYHDKKH